MNNLVEKELQQESLSLDEFSHILTAYSGIKNMIELLSKKDRCTIDSIDSMHKLLMIIKIEIKNSTRIDTVLEHIDTLENMLVDLMNVFKYDIRNN